jgi:hypothetical protein
VCCSTKAKCCGQVCCAADQDCIDPAHNVCQQHVAVSYQAGWNLVSGPDGSRLSGAIGNLYTFQPGDTQYEVAPVDTPLVACRGYWAYFTSGGSLSPGSSQATCSPAISPGNWVMVGNPSVEGAATVTGADSVLAYTPAEGYRVSATIPVGSGAWMLASGAVTIAAPVQADGPCDPTCLEGQECCLMASGILECCPTGDVCCHTATPHFCCVQGGTCCGQACCAPDEPCCPVDGGHTCCDVQQHCCSDGTGCCPPD